MRVAEATALDRSGFDVVFADPARRTSRAGSSTSTRTRLRGPSSRGSWGRAVVKVAPGIPHDLLPPGVEAEWVSDAGEVKEAVLWSPAMATTRRRATVIRGAGLATLTVEDDPGAAEERSPGRYLYEPDGAVIRAGLVTAVAAGVDGALLDRHIAYVTGDAPYTTPFARSYEVLETLPYQEKALRAALRTRNIGRLTIKKRGVAVVPEQLRRRLALRGDEEATVVLSRSQGHGVALLVRPFGERPH